jgi:hypothetical protein
MTGNDLYWLRRRLRISYAELGRALGSRHGSDQTANRFARRLIALREETIKDIYAERAAALAATKRPTN